MHPSLAIPPSAASGCQSKWFQGMHPTKETSTVDLKDYQILKSEMQL